jgi:hypothetical protein
MKIGILTLYNAINAGAFLQAYALQKLLISLGHDPEFINFTTPRYVYKKYRPYVTRQPGYIIFSIILIAKFMKAWRKLNLAGMRARSKKYDAVIIGSDEVWNLTNDTFDHIPQFFGNALKSDHIIAYAPSCGPTSYEDITSHAGAVEGIRNMHAVSGRDNNTVDLLRTVTGRSVPMVLDPTLLVDFSDDEISQADRDYILVYAVGLQNHQISRIKAFAKKVKKPLVSPCFYNTWCDKSIAASPGEFLGLIRNADYVITNTFHGTLFSLRYHRQFGTFVEKSHKIKSVLSSLGIEDRNISDMPELDTVVLRPVDFEAIDRKIAEERGKSLKFIRDSLA